MLALDIILVRDTQKFNVKVFSKKILKHQLRYF